MYRANSIRSSAQLALSFILLILLLCFFRLRKGTVTQLLFFSFLLPFYSAFGHSTPSPILPSPKSICFNGRSFALQICTRRVFCSSIAFLLFCRPLYGPLLNIYSPPRRRRRHHFTNISCSKTEFSQMLHHYTTNCSLLVSLT